MVKLRLKEDMSDATSNGNDSVKYPTYSWNWDGKPVFVKE